MGDKKKVPDDMGLFRDSLGDVRPINRKNRVQSQPRRTSRKSRSPVTGADNSPPADKCLVSPQKKSFETMKEAMTVAQQVEREWDNPVRPYLCHSCGRFHLTKNQAR